MIYLIKSRIVIECVSFFFLLQFGMNGADQDKSINSCKGSSWDKSPIINVPSTISDGRNKIKLSVSTAPFTLPCKNPYKVSNVSADVTFLPSGQLTHISWTLPYKTYYDIREYCIKRLTQDEMEVYICLSNCDPKYQEPIHAEKYQKKDICVSKCCHSGFVYDFSGEEPECKEAGKIKWQPKIYKSSSLDNICIEKKEYDDERMNSRIRYQNIIGPQCKIDPFFVYPAISFLFNGDLNLRTSFRVLDNGELVERSRKRNAVTLSKRWTELKRFTFCVDGLQNFNSDSTLYTGDSSHQLFYACEDSVNETIHGSNLTYFEKDSGNETGAEQEELMEDMTSTSDQSNDNSDNHIVTKIRISALSLSLVPLSLTLVSYWLTWDSQNIHGWTVFSHVACLLLMNLFLGISALLNLSLKMGEPSNTCYTIGVLSHFFFLSTFFWLTMVNLDLWLTFKNLKPSGRTTNGLRHIIAYALFSFLGPLLIVVVGIGLDSKYGANGVDSDCDVIVPSYGESVCWIHRVAEGVYLYYIVGVLVLLNFVFFVLTVYVLHVYKKGAKNLNQNKTDAAKQSRDLFIRLFIVMGASYTLDFISWACNASNLEEELSWPWLIIDIVNIFGRATFIFIIFACKRKTFNELRKRSSKSVFLSSVLSRMSVGGYAVDDAFNTNSIKMTTVEKSRTSFS